MVTNKIIIDGASIWSFAEMLIAEFLGMAVGCKHGVQRKLKRLPLHSIGKFIEVGTGHHVSKIMSP